VRGVWGALVVVAGLGVIACFSALVTMHFAIHGGEVAVPEVRGLTVAGAVQKGALLGLNVKVEGKLYSTTLGPGRVVAQVPAAGMVVRRDWTMQVLESLGPERVAVPDVVGQREGEAGMAIRRSGLELGGVARMGDALVAPGTVLAQDPGAGAEGVEEPAVGLLVAGGDVREEGWMMPDWRGVAVGVAQGELARVGLPTAEVREVDGAAGVVVRQQPAAGARLGSGGKVVLEVGRGVAQP
jgi:eukaryotic-like serine/threonine-protein kinase